MRPEEQDILYDFIETLVICHDTNDTLHGKLEQIKAEIKSGKLNNMYDIARDLYVYSQMDRLTGE